MKKYYAVDEGGFHTIVKVLELRETPKMLIHDESGDKFKKTEQGEIIASNRKFKDWSHYGYNIYSIDSNYPKELIRKEKEKVYMQKVKDAIIAKAKIVKSFDIALSLNDLLSLGIDHPHKRD